MTLSFKTVPVVNQPCENCPWRTANHGKRTTYRFFTKANRQRLWNQIRRGEGIQSCHQTDPSHPDHVATGTKLTATPHECMGSVILVVRELDRLVEGDWDQVVEPGHCDRYLASDRNRRFGLRKSGLLYYLMNRQMNPPMGDGKLPDPPKGSLGSDEFGTGLEA